MQRIWPSYAELDDDDAVRAAYAVDRSRAAVRMNFVSSLDGAVEVDGYSRGLSDPADQQILQVLRSHADAVMVGAGTLRHEGYGPVAAPRTLVIVSGSLDLDPRHRVFTEAPVRPVVLTHAGAPADRRAGLEPVADVVTCGGTVVDLAVGLAELRSRGLDQVLCEGGPHLFGALLSADLVDEMCLTVSAKLAGSGASRIVADGRRDVPLTMSLIHVIAAGDTLLTRYGRA